MTHLKPVTQEKPICSIHKVEVQTKLGILVEGKQICPICQSEASIPPWT